MATIALASSTVRSNRSACQVTMALRRPARWSARTSPRRRSKLSRLTLDAQGASIGCLGDPDVDPRDGWWLGRHVAPSGASLTETSCNLAPLYGVRCGEPGDPEVGGDQPPAGQGGVHAGGGQQ